MAHFNSWPTELILEVVGYLTDPVDVGNFSMTCKQVDSIVDPLLQQMYGAWIVGDPNLYHFDFMDSNCPGMGASEPRTRFAALRNKVEYRKRHEDERDDAWSYLLALAKCKRLTKWDYMLNDLAPSHPKPQQNQISALLENTLTHLKFPPEKLPGVLESLLWDDPYTIFVTILLMLPNLEILDLTHTNFEGCLTFDGLAEFVQKHAFGRLTTVNLRGPGRDLYGGTIGFVEPLLMVPSLRKIIVCHIDLNKLTAQEPLPHVEVLMIDNSGQSGEDLVSLLKRTPNLRYFKYDHAQGSPELDIFTLRDAMSNVASALEQLILYDPWTTIVRDRQSGAPHFSRPAVLDLSSFSRLREAVLSWNLVIDATLDDDQQLVRMMPSSLTVLDLAFVPHINIQESGLVSKNLTHLVEKKAKDAQKLELILIYVDKKKVDRSCYVSVREACKRVGFRFREEIYGSFSFADFVGQRYPSKYRRPKSPVASRREEADDEISDDESLSDSELDEDQYIKRVTKKQLKKLGLGPYFGGRLTYEELKRVLKRFGPYYGNRIVWY